MSFYIHEAIRALNSEVVTIYEDIAYDAENNIIEYDKNAAEAYANEMKSLLAQFISHTFEKLHFAPNIIH